LDYLKNKAKSGDMENLNSLLKFCVWESGRKIDPVTGVSIVTIIKITKLSKCLPTKWLQCSLSPYAHSKYFLFSNLFRFSRAILFSSLGRNKIKYNGVYMQHVPCSFFAASNIIILQLQISSFHQYVD